MSDRRDPRIRALIVELSESSPQAPTFAEIEDCAAEPVGTGALRPLVAARPRRGWAFGVAAAAAVVALLLIGGPLFLLRDSADTEIEPLTPVIVATTVTMPPTTVPPTTQTTLGAVPPGVVWTGPIDPITLTLDPPVVAAEIGTITVTVTGRSPDDIWLMVCRGARGVVNPENWPGYSTWDGDMAAVCGDVSREAGTLVNPQIEGGSFEAALEVPIDAQAIRDGGVVVTTGDIWIPLRGNALLQIADAAGAADPSDRQGDNADGRVSAVPSFTWQAVTALGPIVDMEAFDGGFVAVLEPDEGRAPGTIAESIDGLEWTVLVDQPGWRSTGDVFTHSGSLYAIDNSFDYDEPGVFRLDSLDGAWTRVEVEDRDPDVLAPASGVALAGGEAGVIMIGQSPSDEPLLWRLRDGRMELVGTNLFDQPEIHPTEGTYADHLRLTALEDRFIVELDGIGDGDALRFLSADGREWSPIQLPAGHIWEYAQDGDRLFAIGESGVWVSDVEGESWRLTTEASGSYLTSTPFGVAYSAGQVGVFFDYQGVDMTTDGAQWFTALDAQDHAVTAIAANTERILVATASSEWSDFKSEYSLQVGTPNE